jgi:hypothetical protein
MASADRQVGVTYRGDGPAAAGAAGNEPASRRFRLAGLAELLDRFLLPLVLVFAAAGVALPAPGRRLDAGGAILITLMVLVFCTGSSVTFAEFTGLRTASRRMALVLAATTAVLPVLAWLASRLVSGPALQGGDGGGCRPGRGGVRGP